MEVPRGLLIVDLFVVDLRLAVSNIFSLQIFGRQLVPKIQMYVRVPIDCARLSGDDVMVSDGAIEVSVRVLDDFHGLLRPCIQDNTTRTKCPCTVKSKRCALSEADPAIKFNESKGSVTRSKGMSLWVDMLSICVH